MPTKQNKGEEKQKKSKSRQWTEQENMRFAFSLIIYDQILELNKKKTQFFGKLSKLTKKKAQQNRTHSVKMVKQFLQSQCPQRQFLYYFYYQKFIIRHLGEEQLKKEVRIFINSLEIDQEQKCDYIKKAFNNLRRLQLDMHARSFKFKYKNTEEQYQDKIDSQINDKLNFIHRNELDPAYLYPTLPQEQIGSTEPLPYIIQQEFNINIGDQSILSSQRSIQSKQSELVDKSRRDSEYLSQIVEPKLRFKPLNSHQQYDYNEEYYRPSEQQNCFEEYLN